MLLLRPSLVFPCRSGFPAALVSAHHLVPKMQGRVQDIPKPLFLGQWRTHATHPVRLNRAGAGCPLWEESSGCVPRQRDGRRREQFRHATLRHRVARSCGAWRLVGMPQREFCRASMTVLSHRASRCKRSRPRHPVHLWTPGCCLFSLSQVLIAFELRAASVLHRQGHR